MPVPWILWVKYWARSMRCWLVSVGCCAVSLGILFVHVYIYINMHRDKLVFFMMHLMLVPNSVNHSYTSKVYHKISAKNWPSLTPKNLWMNHPFSFIASSYWKSTVTSHQTARHMYGASEVWFKNGATLRFCFWIWGTDTVEHVNLRANL